MFRGAITALITPFDMKGNFDKPSFKRLIDFQIDNHIDGIVPCGTTGESPTLSHGEHHEVVQLAVEYARGRTPIIAGAGSNSTKEAIDLSKNAKNVGAHATLHVCPYYNKPTQEGLFEHFSAIADAVDIPIIVYNIQGRTAVNMETATLARLAKEHSNIVGVKEASGNISQMGDVLLQLPKKFCVLSGDDNMTYPLMALGGKGVISVVSNIIPKEMHALTQYMLEGEYAKAKELHYRYLSLFKDCFIETNPIPIKTALAMKGLCQESFRLPMCRMQNDNKKKLTEVLKKLKIL